MREYCYPPMPEVKEGEKFIFRNQALMNLWKEELTGQLSDGKWENSWHGRHMQDWAYWVDLPTEIGPETKLIKTSYNIQCHTGFNSKDLVECVGNRMLEIVRKTEPNATEKIMRSYLAEISKAIRTAYHPKTITYQPGLETSLGREMNSYHTSTPQEIEAAGPPPFEAEKPKCKLIGTDGNVFALAGQVSKVLKNAGQPEKAKEFTEKLFQCGSYNEALVLMGNYVEIQ